MAGRLKEQMTWDQYAALPLTEQGGYLATTPHTLIAQQFTRADLEMLCSLATKIRRISKQREGVVFLKTLMSGRRAMLYFAQPSSRTYLSFQAACQILGFDTMEVRDSKTSSEVKGESPEDTLRTFSSYADMIVMRHPVGGFAERVAWMLSQSNREIPVLNAGSGADQHPTQALLDIYTMERSFERLGGMDGKQVVFSGDLKRGRTVRSLAWMLTLYRDMTLHFATPMVLQIGEDILALLDAAGTSYHITENFDAALPLADAVYMTRLQDEWDGEDRKSSIDPVAYSIGAHHLPQMKAHAVIMHPLPRRHEISTEIDNEPRAVYWRQMRNGMWIRAALILSTFGGEEEVNRYCAATGMQAGPEKVP